MPEEDDLGDIEMSGGVVQQTVGKGTQEGTRGANPLSKHVHEKGMLRPNQVGDVASDGTWRPSPSGAARLLSSMVHSVSVGVLSGGQSKRSKRQGILDLPCAAI